MKLLRRVIFTPLYVAALLLLVPIFIGGGIVVFIEEIVRKGPVKVFKERIIKGIW